MADPNHSKQPELLDLTHDEVQSLLRPRAGFEAFVEPLVELYQAKTEELHIKGFAPDALLDEVDTYETLLAMEAETKARLALIQKTRLFHASNIWRAMLEIYVRAQSAGRTDADVLRAIEIFAAFMKNGPRKKPPVSSSTSSLPTS